MVSMCVHQDNRDTQLRSEGDDRQTLDQAFNASLEQCDDALLVLIVMRFFVQRVAQNYSSEEFMLHDEGRDDTPSSLTGGGGEHSPDSSNSSENHDGTCFRGVVESTGYGSVSKCYVSALGALAGG